ncbi:MAG: hypothetical protein U9Q66_02570 [Patescibacteria group bacterium]|nr:hypothetical protein [Patescibacteria group bacterium]
MRNKSIKKNALPISVVSKIVKLKTEEYNGVKVKYTKVFNNIDKELSDLVYISEDINILRYKLRTTYKDWLN